MHYAHILRGEAFPDVTYIGPTSDPGKRLTEHNSGISIHTTKFRPWDLVGYIAFPEIPLAEKSERYLKSASGRALAKRHLLMQNGPKS
jgi:putative endonuclease